MKHKSVGRKFGRVRRQRRALISGLLANLIMEGKITTTEAKAKTTKSEVDRIITRMKKSRVDKIKRIATVRNLSKVLPTQAVEKIFSDDFFKKVEGRDSGYTRVIKLAPRQSDSARMAVIELVD